MRFLFSLLIVCGLLLAMPAHAAEKSKKPDPNAPPPEFEYLQMAPLMIPVLNDKGVTQQVSIIVSLEVKHGTKDAIKPMEPKLADAYIQDLYGIFGSGYGFIRGGVLDVQLIKNRLTDVTRKILGEEKFHDVLLQVVHQQQY